MDVTRRNLIQILGIAPAAAAALTQAEHTHAAPPAPAKKAYQRKVFDDRQWRSVQVLCDLIIPADEHSGSATAAGVPEFIDDWLDFRAREDGNQNLTAGVLGGLAWLDLETTRLFQKDFAAAAPAEQKQILDRIAWPARAAAEDSRWAQYSSPGAEPLVRVGNTTLVDEAFDTPPLATTFQVTASEEVKESAISSTGRVVFAEIG